MFDRIVSQWRIGMAAEYYAKMKRYSMGWHGKHVRSCAKWIDSHLECTCEREIVSEWNRRQAWRKHGIWK